MRQILDQHAVALIGWDIFDFSSEIAEFYVAKLDRKQDLNVLYHVWRSENQDGRPASGWLVVLRINVA